eukprot:4823048-Prymnesium_polylepis.1
MHLVLRPPLPGFCAISDVLPLPHGRTNELTTPAVEGNGMNAVFCKTIHCVSAEPHATFLRVAVGDGWQEVVAFETAVLGRLRLGYRVFLMRSVLGTRIELCYLFVK